MKHNHSTFSVPTIAYIFEFARCNTDIKISTFFELLKPFSYPYSKSNYSTKENCIRAYVTGPDTLSVRLGDCAERLDVTCLGVYIPVVTEAARPSVITVSFEFSFKVGAISYQPYAALLRCMYSRTSLAQTSLEP